MVLKSCDALKHLVCSERLILLLIYLEPRLRTNKIEPAKGMSNRCAARAAVGVSRARWHDKPFAT